MGNPAARTPMSPQEYLAFERAAEQRHEYADGEVYAMAGATREHNLVMGNIFGELRTALLDRPCEVYGSDMRVHIAATGRYVYPDVSVVCGGPSFQDDKRDTLLDPLVIVEVLSESTEAYDRADKFDQYRSVASVQDYVLASQTRPRIEHYRRQPDGSWVLRVLGPGDVVALETIGCELAVDRAYLKVFDGPRA